MKTNPAERFTAKQALQHKWFQEDLKAQKVADLQKAKAKMLKRKQSKLYKSKEFQHLE